MKRTRIAVPLHYEKNDEIAVFTFENGSVNPLSPQMHVELHKALKDFVSDTSIRCGIMKGAGTRAFCAGDDIKGANSSAPPRTPQEALKDHLWPHRNPDAEPDPSAWAREVLAIERFKPIIAAVDGWCLGQGMIYLTLLTDLRIATPEAKFGLPEIAYQMAGASGSIRLGRQIPHTAALWMALTGEPLSAEEALRYNLINRVVEREDLMPTAIEVARKICRHPAESVRIEMESYYRANDMTRNDALAFTRHLYRIQRFGADRSGPGLNKDTFLYRNKEKKS